ncbi:hypothetical protein VCUG_00368 [Vavraia culicis subsp. floridensis]|uniref:Uncharacterized protein n=1 Tax=Vavraia culicis (isolate floridensis) TaxID=948595 RepID=L2GYF6_VAVCU|nr:uncharacterized protein VCUG_00368 [Vavraia culicis subsp. floridensis]ELA48130.1 hypothetical protein VCUG_00368 [Vavraia culicis subsp. floridensis]
MSSFPLDPTFLTKDEENGKKLTIEDVRDEYERIREQMYKEMEIERVQNNIYQKLYNRTKSNTFYFDRVQKRDEIASHAEDDAYTIMNSLAVAKHNGDSANEVIDETRRGEYIGSEGIADTIVESEVEDDSNIVDLNNITDSEEESMQQDRYVSKYLDIEAEEGSTGSEIEVMEEKYEYSKDTRNQDDIIKRLERKYLRRKKVEKLEPLFKIEDVSSSEEALDFVNLSTDNIECNITKDEDSVECVENERERDMDEHMAGRDANLYDFMKSSRKKRR